MLHLSIWSIYWRLFLFYYQILEPNNMLLAQRRIKCRNPISMSINSAANNGTGAPVILFHYRWIFIDTMHYIFLIHLVPNSYCRFLINLLPHFQAVNVKNTTYVSLSTINERWLFYDRGSIRVICFLAGSGI